MPKIVTSTSEKQAALRKFLEGLPHLAFTSTGVTNICKRFHVTEADVLSAIDALNIERTRQGGSGPWV